MTTIDQSPPRRPLAYVGTPVGPLDRYRCTVELAPGALLGPVSALVIGMLNLRAGLTRCSAITAAAYPPHQAADVLARLRGLSDLDRTYAEELLATTGAPLWLFVAECRVLWPQDARGVHLS